MMMTVLSGVSATRLGRIDRDRQHTGRSACGRIQTQPIHILVTVQLRLPVPNVADVQRRLFGGGCAPAGSCQCN